MRTFIRNNLMLTAVLVLASPLAGVLGWELAAPIRGALVASFDVVHGHYEVLSLGFPNPSRPEYARLLRERYGINLRTGGCVVSYSLSAYVNGYNWVSTSAANWKFGRDVFQESAADAGRNWKLTHRREWEK